MWRGYFCRVIQLIIFKHAKVQKISPSNVTGKIMEYLQVLLPFSSSSSCSFFVYIVSMIFKRIKSNKKETWRKKWNAHKRRPQKCVSLCYTDSFRSLLNIMWRWGFADVTGSSTSMWKFTCELIIWLILYQDSTLEKKNLG